MYFKELKELWISDASMYHEVINKKTIIKLYFQAPGFRYSFWLRLCTFFSNKNKMLYYFFRLILQHYSFKFGIQISPKTKIGKCLSIFHFGGIVISVDAIIGDNLSIRQGVTIGNTDKGSPIVGNNVFIGTGGKILGNVKIGDNVKIGANTVVLKDVPDNSTAVGVPARIIYHK